MSKITVFNQLNRVVVCNEEGLEIAPLEQAEVEATDKVAAFAIEQGSLVVLSSIEVAQPVPSEAEQIQTEEVTETPEPETEEVEETEEEEVTESVEEVKPAPRTRKKTSTQVKES